MWKKDLDIFGNLSILSRETVLSKYPNLPEVIAQRSTPGILIFTASGELLYINTEARGLVKPFSGDGNGSSSPQQNESLSIPETLTNLCNQLKHMVLSHKLEAPHRKRSQTPSVLAVATLGPEIYSFRAFLLSQDQDDLNEGAYILVLIERVSPSKKKINIDKTRQRFNLTNRESEVVELLLLGLKNKEIADRLSVCVYTIEDHLKKIMKKMQVGNRTSIFAKLLQD